VDAVPTDDEMVIEETTDDQGKINLVFHTIYGRRVNDALCRIFANRMSQRMNTNVGIVVEDHGFVLILPRRPHDLDDVMDEITELDLREELKDAIRKTELMKRRFRHVAGRALMILRNYKGNQKSVGKQQMKSHFLLSACEKIDPEFPIIKETYREIMEDHMDIQHAAEIVDGLQNGDIDYTHISTDIPSPFAHNLVLQGQSDVIMLEDKQERLQQLHKEVMERIGEPIETAE
jgi:ATP-dependent Lhr-like helicase